MRHRQFENPQSATAGRPYSLAFALLMIVLATGCHKRQTPRDLDTWKERLVSAERAFTENPPSDEWAAASTSESLLLSKVMLGEQNPKELARDLVTTKPKGHEHARASLVEVCAKLGRYDEANAIASTIEIDHLRSNAYDEIAMAKFRAGDVAEAMQLVASRGDSDHDEFVEWIIRDLLAKREFTQARGYLARLRSSDARAKLTELAQWEEQIAQPGQPDFVSRATAQRIERVIHRHGGEVPAFLADGSSSRELFSSATRYRHRARLADFNGQTRECLKSLSAYFDTATKLDDDQRLFECLAAACLAHELGQEDWARAKMMALGSDPNFASTCIGLELSGIKAMQAVVKTLNNKELVELCKQSEESEAIVSLPAMVTAALMIAKDVDNSTICTKTMIPNPSPIVIVSNSATSRFVR